MLYLIVCSNRVEEVTRICQAIGSNRSQVWYFEMCSKDL
jgi:hypothetical protein